MKMNVKTWVGGLIGVLIIAIVAITQLRANLSPTAPQTGDTVTTFVGSLSQNATTTGQVQAQRTADLALLSSGEVADVYVAVGDRVEAGEPLLVLETAVLENAVATAEQNRIIAQTNLATLLEPATASAVAAAEADLASAQANADAVVNGPTASEIATAEASLRAAEAEVAAASARLNGLTTPASDNEIHAAEIALEQAQIAVTQAEEAHRTALVTEPNSWLSTEAIADMEVSARANVLQTRATLADAESTLAQLQNGNSHTIASTQSSLAAAVANRDIAQAQLDAVLAGPTTADIAAAEATVAQAEASLAALQRGPTPLQITQAEVQLAQADINLALARHNLANATLVAPFEGVITAVHVHIGEQASGVVVELVDPTSLEVVLAIDEVDLDQVAVGQIASLSLEAWPQVALSGELVAIAPQAQNNNAIATYDAYIALDNNTLPILPGMTVNASLRTDQRDNVLLIANQAITVDRANGTYFVTQLYADGTEAQQSVTIGLRDGQYTEIIEGLAEGDVVRVGDFSAPMIDLTEGPDQAPDN